MNGSRFARWPLQRRKGLFSQEAGAAIFQGLRLRLTLWYCGVLGAALVLFSVFLYFGTQYFLLTPVEKDAEARAHAHVQQWRTDSSVRACSLFGPRGPSGPPPALGFTMTEMVACFDQNGSLLLNDNTANLPAAFLTNTLA